MGPLWLLKVSGPQTVRMNNFTHFDILIPVGNTFLALYIFICDEIYIPQNLVRSGSELRGLQK